MQYWLTAPIWKIDQLYKQRPDQEVLAAIFGLMGLKSETCRVGLQVVFANCPRSIAMAAVALTAQNMSMVMSGLALRFLTVELAICPSSAQKRIARNFYTLCLL